MCYYLNVQSHGQRVKRFTSVFVYTIAKKHQCDIKVKKTKLAPTKCMFMVRTLLSHHLIYCLAIFIIQGDKKKRELLKYPTKIEEIPPSKKKKY